MLNIDSFKNLFCCWNFELKKKIKKSTGLVVYTQCTMQLF